MHKSNLFKAGLMAATFAGFAAAFDPWAKASAPAKPRRKSRWQNAHALQAAEAKRARRAARNLRNASGDYRLKNAD